MERSIFAQAGAHTQLSQRDQSRGRQETQAKLKVRLERSQYWKSLLDRVSTENLDAAILQTFILSLSTVLDCLQAALNPRSIYYPAYAPCLETSR